MQSPELPLLSPPQQTMSSAAEEGPIPANELARLSRNRQRHKSSLRALLKLVILIGFIVLMILSIAIIVLGAITQIQKRKEILLIMLNNRAEPMPFVLPEGIDDDLDVMFTQTEIASPSKTIQVMLPKKLPEKETASVEMVKRIR